MTLTLDQLKKIKLPLGTTNKCGKSSCSIDVSMYEILNSYFGSNGSFSIITDSTLAGAGNSNSKLKIAQQSATSGQVLTWNGTTWAPQNPSLSLPLNDLSDVIISSPSTTQLLRFDGTQWVNWTPNFVTSPTPSMAGQITYWTGFNWALALEYINEQEPPAGTTDISLPHTPIAALKIKVYLNGVLKRNLYDYTISGSLITFNYVFAVNDKVTTIYYN